MSNTSSNDPIYGGPVPQDPPDIEHITADGATVGPSWEDYLIRNKEGVPKNNTANAVTIIRRHPELEGRIGWDEFANRITLRGTVPFLPDARAGSRWQNGDEAMLAAWIQAEGYNISLANVKAALLPVSRLNGFHPVREYLDGLEWDGQDRIEGWLTSYLGATMSEYSSAVGQRWLMSAVARIFDPGCQADCMIVLEGPQGIGKSSALRILGGQWFTDELAAFSSKDASQQLQGAWIIEMSELDTLTKAEASEAKAFISRRVDRFRPPYGAVVEDYPRQCIFAGTVNLDTYLKDETGGRRFWPIRCGVTGMVDLKGLEAARDQLWAEAVVRYRAGQAIYLETLELRKLAAQEVKDRQHVDVWTDAVERIVRLRDAVYIAEILDELDVPTGQRNNGHSIRIGRILRHIGFQPKRTKHGWQFLRSESEN